MNTNTRKLVSRQMLLFELRNVVGNPYVHIFGIGLPALLAILVCRVASSEAPNEMITSMVTTSIYLGMGSLIPLATILMGYSIGYAQELDKGIPQRMQLFGIKTSVTLLNRAIAEIIFITVGFLLFFTSGYLIFDLKRPVATGIFSYILCMLLFSLICLGLGHGIASLCHSFGRAYCVSMITYFAFMILGGMMGISFDDLPEWAKFFSKLLPVTYMNKDFYKIWTGKPYNFMPLIQSFLFLTAIAGILLFFTGKNRGGSKSVKMK